MALSKDTVIVINSGYYNPPHRGHLECLNLSKNLYKKVHMILLLNNDTQAVLKKGYVFMPLEDRLELVKGLRDVDEVFVSIDNDSSVCKSLEAIAKKYSGYKVVFAKGGDRNTKNIPENPVCEQYGIEIVDGIGEKVQSSSNMISFLDKYIQDKSKKENMAVIRRLILANRRTVKIARVISLTALCAVSLSILLLLNFI